jgi:sulfur-oxidizing protein SoxY
MRSKTKEHVVDRRFALKTFVGGGAVLAASAAFAQTPPAATDAPGWPAEAFRQKTEADSLKALYGKTAEKSDQVTLDAPEIAENGAVVPISVSTSLPNVTSIAILVAENPFTLTAMYKLPEGALPAVSNRLKMAKTTIVIAVVEAGGKLYSAQKEVKVTVGGCGG